MAPRVGEDGSLARPGDNVVDDVDPCIDIHDPFDVATEIVWNERGRGVVDDDSDDDAEDLAHDFARVLAATMGDALPATTGLPPLFGPPEEFRLFAGADGIDGDDNEEDEDADDEHSMEDDEDEESPAEEFDDESDCSDEVDNFREMRARRLRRMVLRAMMGANVPDDEDDGFEFDELDYEFHEVPFVNRIVDEDNFCASPSAEDGEDGDEDHASGTELHVEIPDEDNEAVADRLLQGRGGHVRESFTGSPARAAPASISSDDYVPVRELCDPVAEPENGSQVEDLPASPRFSRCFTRQNQRGSHQSPQIRQRRRRHLSSGPAPESVPSGTDRGEVVSARPCPSTNEVDRTPSAGSETGKARMEDNNMVSPSLDRRKEPRCFD